MKREELTETFQIERNPLVSMVYKKYFSALGVSRRIDSFHTTAHCVVVVPNTSFVHHFGAY